MTEKVGIVGAGLVGCLTALALAGKGYDVSLFELRDDPRGKDSAHDSKSINLAVSDRGIRALKAVDSAMADRILEHVVPMKGRMIHDVTGTKLDSQLYGLFGESINSIDRLFLNKCLLDELDKSSATVHFKHKLVAVKNVHGASKPELHFVDLSDRPGTQSSQSFDYVFGTDGAHSQFRYQMQKGMRMDFSQKYIDMSYIELSIPAVKGAAPDSPERFSIDANHLHIWPRKDYMLIALANGDGSFTSTFFCPWGLIEAIDSDEQFVKFFANNFPDAYKLMGEQSLKHAFNHQHRGSLIQVAVGQFASPNARALLLGDSAHSMVPFYGQGMNCGFEDVTVLLGLLDTHGGDLKAAISHFTAARKEDVDAICKLAMDNYYEMSTKVTDPFYLVRKKVDYFLGKYASGYLFSWTPMYTMISFRGDIRYSEAVAIEKRQTRILNWVQYATVGGAGIYLAAKCAQYWRR